MRLLLQRVGRGAASSVGPSKLAREVLVSQRVGESNASLSSPTDCPRSAGVNRVEPGTYFGPDARHIILKP